MASVRTNTHSRARAVPWKTPADLIWVRDAFYPGPDSPDRRYNALSMVQAWSVHGRLPHSVEATAMLTEAIIHDRPGTSQMHLQLSYSTAICRFVNGLLDPAQQSHFAISMHTLARNLNLPASFVEIRHAATHETLPSLAVLRTAASRALGWLWSNYWIWVGAIPIVETDTAEEPQDVNLSRARLLLKQWRKLRREKPTREIKEGENVPESREALGIIRECAAVCATVDGLDGIIDALLEEKALIPSGKRKSSSLMKGAFLLWLPLLEPLDVSIPGFMEQLISSMLEILKAGAPDLSIREENSIASTPAPVPEEKEFNRALAAWIKQLVGEYFIRRFGKTGSIGNTTFDMHYMAKQCIFYPNEWTLEILDHIFKYHPVLDSQYSALALLARTQLSMAARVWGSQDRPSKKALNGTSTRPIQVIEDELSRFEEMLLSMDQQMRKWAQETREDTEAIPEEPIATERRQKADARQELPQRWMKYPGVWRPRPIGTL